MKIVTSSLKLCAVMLIGILVVFQMEQQVQSSRYSVSEDLYGDQASLGAIAEKLSVITEDVNYDAQNNVYETTKGTYHVTFKNGEVKQVIEVIK